MARLISKRKRRFDMGVPPAELLARDANAPSVDSRMPALAGFAPTEASR